MIFERQDKVLENLKVEDAIEQLLIHTRIIQETETVDSGKNTCRGYESGA